MAALSKRKLASRISILAATCALLQCCVFIFTWVADYTRNPNYLDHLCMLLIGVFVPAFFFITFLALYKFAHRKKLSFALGYTITYTVVTYCGFAVVSFFIIFAQK
ncbi:MAG: hypothetical protein V4488_17340 [Pseudomonadota bacterium]